MKKLIIVMLFMMISVGVLSANVTVESTISSSEIGINDNVVYAIEISSDSKKQLKVKVNLSSSPYEIKGPSVSTGSSTSIVNGRVSSSKSKTYSYRIYPRKEGLLIVPATQVVVNGKSYRTNSHKINVVKSRKSTQRQSSNRTQSRNSLFNNNRSFNQKQSGSSSTFFRTEVSQDSLFIGQDLEVSYTLYTRASIYSSNYNVETFDGYGVESVKEGESTWVNKVINGMRYRTTLVEKYKVTPNETGILKLPVVSFTSDPFFNRNKVYSANRQIFVSDLPEEGKGIDFSNGIGKFILETKLSRHTINDNQECEYIVTISGKGNFNNILYPQAPVVDGVEVLEPRAEFEELSQGGGILTLKYTIIPSESGKFKIPVMNFNYYDTSLNRYNTIYSNNETLTVKSLSENSIAAEQATNNYFYYKNKSYSGSITKEYLLVRNGGYWTLLIVVLLAVMGYLGYYKYRSIKLQDKDYVRRVNAEKELVKGLKKAEELASKNDKEFYSVVQNSLMNFITLITNVSLQNSKRELIQALEKSYVNNITAQRIDQFLDYCEQIKYQPNFEPAVTIGKDLEKLKLIFSEIERSNRG